MGASESKEIVYAYPVKDSKKPGQTAIYRNPETMDGLKVGYEGLESLGDAWKRNMQESPDKPFLGYRTNINGILSRHYVFMNYREIKLRANDLGSGIVHMGLAPQRSEYRNYNLNMVAVYSKNTPEYVILDAACCLYGITTVPIYDTLGEEACQYMFNETNLTTVFCSSDHLLGLKKNIENGNYSTLKNLVILDPKICKEEDLKSGDNYNVYKLEEIMVAGKENHQDYVKTGMDDVYTFSYTSGTTGAPKGALITHGNMLSMINAMMPVIDANVQGEVRYCSYLPLAHVYERVIMNFMLIAKAKYGIFSGDVFKLSEDLTALKPTVFASVPRLYNKFYEGIVQKTKEQKGLKKNMYTKGLTKKLSNQRKNGTCVSKWWDGLVFKNFKTKLGGEVQIMLTASAPIDPSVLEFLKVHFCAPILEAYGQTEGTGGEFSSGCDDPIIGHVGGPMVCNEFKLVDVPDMKYTHEDQDAQGRNCPRGEICVRGSNVIPGYYKNEEKTAETIDEDGWLMSGDIGMILPGTNALQIFDRKKNIFKLSQGEYVAPEKLENSLMMCESVAGIFVHGDPLQSVLVGILNINQNIVEKWAKDKNIEGDFSALCRNGEIKKMVMADIGNQQKVAKFKGFERICHIHIDDETFENRGLLTTTFKIKRNDFKEYYKQQITDMYADQMKIEAEKAAKG